MYVDVTSYCILRGAEKGGGGGGGAGGAADPGARRKTWGPGRQAGLFLFLCD